MRRALFKQSHFCTPGQVVTVEVLGEPVCELKVEKPAIYVAAEEQSGVWRLLTDSDLRREWGDGRAALLNCSQTGDAKVTSNASQWATEAIVITERIEERLKYADGYGESLSVFDLRDAINGLADVVKTLAGIIRDNVKDAS